MSTEASSASSSASDSSEKTEAMKKASDLLAQGKRNMLCGEVPKAVNLYEEAVQLLVKSCGELSRDCADAYFSCGSALLELGRMETSVLGAALDGVEVGEEKDEDPDEQFEKPTENDGEERQKLREVVYEAMAEGEREEEYKKSILENSKTTSAESDGTVCDKSGKDETCETASGPEKGDESSMKKDGPTKSSDTVNTNENQNTLCVAGTNDNEPNDESAKPVPVVETNECKEENKRTDEGVESMDEKMNNTDKEGEKLNPCAGDSLVLENSASIENTAVATTVHTSETEVAKVAGKEKSDERANEAGVCDDVEMADQDAVDDGEGDAEEDEENTTEVQDNQEGEEIEGDDKEEDVPNFQLAWEYLDLAKVIYLKSESAEDQLKAAECYIRLGELSMETEQHATAAEDIESALKIQQKFLPADDRLIAETHYQLGLAYGLGKEFELSIKHYTLAISVIEAKITSLNKLIEEVAADDDNKENCGSDQVKKYQDEIKELQELIPEMRTKIEDTREEAKDAEKMKQMAKEALGLCGPSKTFESPKKRSEPIVGDNTNGDVDENGEKKATDIAHLVRKKRKPENDTLTPADQEVKKLKHDDTSLVDSAATGKVNGSSEVEVKSSGDNNGAEQKTSEPAVVESTSS